MKYRSQPKTQLTTAGAGALGVIAIGLIFYGEIDWPTVIGVTLGLFLGMGFSKKEKERTSADEDVREVHDRENPPSP